MDRRRFGWLDEQIIFIFISKSHVFILQFNIIFLSCLVLSRSVLAAPNRLPLASYYCLITQR